MTRLPLLAAVTGALLLGGCSQDDGRDLARYYDEQGLFTVDLPAENELAVTPPQPAQDGPGLLTGVVSSPPAPSPQAQPGLGSALAPTEPTDQTIYQAFAVTSDGFEDLDEMALYFLTGDPIVDVVVDRHGFHLADPQDATWVVPSHDKEMPPAVFPTPAAAYTAWMQSQEVAKGRKPRQTDVLRQPVSGGFTE